jgi:flavin reductase (DIM6/NTAB) family NADH-FMN oxidoreductase RutF
MKSINELFVKVEPEQLKDNFFRTIDNDWMLITAGSAQKFNTMTASWGAMGILWNFPIAICFIRPTRYTFSFVNDHDHFTLSFFTEKEKGILNYCGSRSGRNTDKIAQTGLKPLLTEQQGITFEQSRLCIECQKVYADDLRPEKFIMQSLDAKNYPGKDYHRFFIGKISSCYMPIK